LHAYLHWCPLTSIGVVAAVQLAQQNFYILSIFDFYRLFPSRGFILLFSTQVLLG